MQWRALVERPGDVHLDAPAQERLQGDGVAPGGGHVDRHLAPGAATAGLEHCGGGGLLVALGQVQRGAALADGVHRRAALEQQRDDVGAALGGGGVKRCPAAVGARCLVRAVVEQQLGRLGLVGLGGPVQRRGLVFFHAKMNVGPVAFQPAIERLDVAVARG